VPTTTPAAQNGQANGNAQGGAAYCALAIDSGAPAMPIANPTEISTRETRIMGLLVKPRTSNQRTAQRR
jgi:hypothetical protein